MALNQKQKPSSPDRPPAWQSSTSSALRALSRPLPRPRPLFAASFDGHPRFLSLDCRLPTGLNRQRRTGCRPVPTSRIPTCLAHRPSHQLSEHGFDPASFNRHSHTAHPAPPPIPVTGKPYRHHGYRGLQADLTTPEDEAAAPAFFAGWGQRSQGSPALIFPPARVETSPGKFHGYFQPQSRERCCQCSESRQGSPEPDEEPVAKVHGHIFATWPAIDEGGTG